MKGHGEKMSRKQEQAIIALLQMPTITEAAKQACIGEATLWRWMQHPEFQASYRGAKRQAVANAIARLQQASSEAVETLQRVMNDPEAPANACVSAAKIVLDMALKGSEIDDLSARVEQLERQSEKKETVYMP